MPDPFLILKPSPLGSHDTLLSGIGILSLPPAFGTTHVENVERYLGRKVDRELALLGGKNLGDLCLRELFTVHGHDLNELVRRGGFAGITIPEAHYVTTEAYHAFERMVDDWPRWIQAHGEPKSPGNVNSSYKLAEILMSAVSGAQEFFVDLARSIRAKYPGTAVILSRGSLISEDFLNDSLAGVSPSKSLPLDDSLAAVTLASQYFNILLSKHFPESQFAPLQRQEALALQVVLKLPYDRHITLFCDEKDGVRIQVIDCRMLGQCQCADPIWLLFELDNSNRIEVFPTFPPLEFSNDYPKLRRMRDRMTPFFTTSINGIPSYISELEICTLADLAREQKHSLGFSTLDAELLLKDKHLYSVQIRPIMEPKGETMSLQTGVKPLAKTPFVLGNRFETEGQLLMLEHGWLEFHSWLTEDPTANFDPGKYIIVTPHEEFFPFSLLRLQASGFPPFAGHVILDFGSELSHVLHPVSRGHTHFLRKLPLAAFPHLRSQLKSMQLLDQEHVSHFTLLGEENPFNYKTSSKKFRLASVDGKYGILSSID